MVYKRSEIDPIAQILSASMMLRYSLGFEEAAEAFDRAVSSTLDKNIMTADIFFDKSFAVNTSVMGDAIVVKAL